MSSRSTCLPPGACQISYAAGSSSLDQYGFRVLDDTAGQRFMQLGRVFPVLTRLLDTSPLLVSAYPAALGLAGFTTFIDTYLHPATFIRSLRLANAEHRSVILVAQPLVGADFLIRHCQANFKMPTRLLWAVGGYYFPLSLERFIRKLLDRHGCQVTFLYAYGVAEVGHTCFAGMARFDSGLPRYYQIADEVTARLDPDTSELILAKGTRQVATGDFAHTIDREWEIRSGQSRLLASVADELERWSTDDWLRRTGYLSAQESQCVYQLREKTADMPSPNELPYHAFWERFGGGLTQKPAWGRPQ